MGAVVNDMPVACQSRDPTELAGENESFAKQILLLFCKSKPFKNIKKLPPNKHNIATLTKNRSVALVLRYQLSSLLLS